MIDLQYKNKFNQRNTSPKGKRISLMGGVKKD